MTVIELKQYRSICREIAEKETEIKEHTVCGTVVGSSPDFPFVKHTITVGGVEHSEKNAEAMAKLRVDDREYWERRYKGYRFLRCFARFNKYNGHWYVSAIMYKAGEKDLLPDWKVGEDEWMSEF